MACFKSTCTFYNENNTQLSFMVISDFHIDELKEIWDKDEHNQIIHILNFLEETLQN
jgi:hypothetical protein